MKVLQALVLAAVSSALLSSCKIPPLGGTIPQHVYLELWAASTPQIDPGGQGAELATAVLTGRVYYNVHGYTHGRAGDTRLTSKEQSFSYLTSALEPMAGQGPLVVNASSRTITMTHSIALNGLQPGESVTLELSFELDTAQGIVDRLAAAPFDNGQQLVSPQLLPVSGRIVGTVDGSPVEISFTQQLEFHRSDHVPQ